MYLYLWDKRWAWGLPYPANPSYVWVALLGVKVASYGNALWDWKQIILVLTILTMFMRQRAVEQVKYMPFALDESQHGICHYFKRRDSLYTYQATLLLVIGVVKVLTITLERGIPEED